METMLNFSEIENEQLYLVSGGCGFCDAGTIIGCAATGIGIGGATGSVPGAIVGGIVGTAVGVLTVLN